MAIDSIMTAVINSMATCLVLPVALLIAMLTHLSHLVLQRYFALLSHSILCHSFQQILENIALCLIYFLLRSCWFCVFGTNVCFTEKSSSVECADDAGKDKGA